MDRSRTTTAAWLAISLAVTCCGKPSPEGTVGAEQAPPDERPETAPTRIPSTSGPDARDFHYEGPCPPPSPAEDHGDAPDKDHEWAHGHFRWTGREHVWVPGAWYAKREDLAFVPTHWEEWHRRWFLIPAHWRPTR